MAAIPDSIKIKLEVDTTEVDEAIEKVKQLNELMEKHVKVQKQGMNIPMFTGEITWDTGDFIQTGTLVANEIVVPPLSKDNERWIKELCKSIDKRVKPVSAEIKDSDLYKEDKTIEDMRKILYEQFKLLKVASEYCSDEELHKLTSEMLEIYKLLCD